MEKGEVLHAEWKSQVKGEEMPLDALASADAAPTCASRLLLWATGLAASHVSGSSASPHTRSLSLRPLLVAAS